VRTRYIYPAQAIQVLGALILAISAWGSSWGEWALFALGGFLLMLGGFGQGYEEGKEEGMNYILWLEGIEQKLEEWKKRRR